MANWISGAIKRPGAFKAKAKAAGESTAEFADEVIAKSKKKKGHKSGGRTLRQALLARTLMGMRKKGGSKMAKSAMRKGMVADDDMDMD